MTMPGTLSFCCVYSVQGSGSTVFPKGCWGSCFSETQPRGASPSTASHTASHLSSAVPITQDCCSSESYLGCSTTCPFSPGTPHSIVKDFLGLSPASPHSFHGNVGSDGTSVLVLSWRPFLFITIAACCHHHHFDCQSVILILNIWPSGNVSSKSLKSKNKEKESVIINRLPAIYPFLFFSLLIFFHKVFVILSE